jgi:methylated-DNA-[protein]-cysteine S-methyltransferase
MITTGTLFFDYFKAADGIGALIFSARGIKSLVLPVGQRSVLKQTVLQRYPTCQPYSSNDIFHISIAQVRKSIISYFSGKRVDFRYPWKEFDLQDFSLFEKRVYEVVYAIPYGTIWSYKQVAQEVGKPKAYRAVGNALAKNAIPVLIPCHRVVGSNHNLGGFSGGLEWKKRLLGLEGIRVENSGVKK